MDDQQFQPQIQDRPQNQLTPFLMPLIIIVVILVLVEVGVHFVSKAILGYPVPNLSSSSLSNGVTESLSNGDSIPVDGKDFTINQVNFFEGTDWAVVVVHPVNNDANDAVVVLQKSGTKYDTIAGPGSSFPLESLPKLPTPVLYYLNSHGLTVNNTDNSNE